MRNCEKTSFFLWPMWNSPWLLLAKSPFERCYDSGWTLDCDFQGHFKCNRDVKIHFFVKTAQVVTTRTNSFGRSEVHQCPYKPICGTHYWLKQWGAQPSTHSKWQHDWPLLQVKCKILPKGYVAELVAGILNRVQLAQEQTIFKSIQRRFSVPFLAAHDKQLHMKAI